jgi:hypothetical protein
LVESHTFSGLGDTTHWLEAAYSSLRNKELVQVSGEASSNGILGSLRLRLGPSFQGCYQSMGLVGLARANTSVGVSPKTYYYCYLLLLLLLLLLVKVDWSLEAYGVQSTAAPTLICVASALLRSGSLCSLCSMVITLYPQVFSTFTFVLMQMPLCCMHIVVLCSPSPACYTSSGHTCMPCICVFCVHMLLMICFLPCHSELNGSMHIQANIRGFCGL